MVSFAGWQMPLQYETGINEEHIAVRTDCGLFDVSQRQRRLLFGHGAGSQAIDSGAA